VQDVIRVAGVVRVDRVAPSTEQLKLLGPHGLTSARPIGAAQESATPVLPGALALVDKELGR
jgi:hypothetical protein